MYDKKPIVVKPWTEDASLTKSKVKEVPIWIRLCGLGLKFWGEKCLTKLVALLGKYVKADTATLDKTRLGYARLMVEVQVGQDFPDKLYFNDEHGHHNCVLVWRPKNVSKPTNSQPMSTNSCVSPPKVTRPHVVTPVARQMTVIGGIRENVSYVVALTSLTKSPVAVLPKDKNISSEDQEKGRTEEVQLLYSSQQQITVSVTETCSRDSFWFTVVYGSNYDTDRIQLWQELKDIKDNCHETWCVGGYFNNLLHFNERLGIPVLWSELEEFRMCVDYCELWDIQAKGSFYTWNDKQAPNTRVFSRIDRFLINHEWLRQYPDGYAFFMNEGLFYHNPCICYRRPTIAVRKSSFRYFNIWGQASEFLNIVQT
ncbi:uncharacterized protein LOC141608024 [Silene latifolia]|uniref:uncharacterized protein LOC141608024 n=1 Tax=Silene latifolia TaxID=37657 RepID=UPI003D773B1F